MTDANHTWNSGDPITAHSPCGCHVAEGVLELCREGKGFKKSVDNWYGLWQAQKDSEVDPVAIRSFLHSFEKHRKGYLKHLETGKDWVL